MQDIDFATTCLTLRRVPDDGPRWSRREPRPRADPRAGRGEGRSASPTLGSASSSPLPVGAAELDALDAEIRSVFDADELLTPDDVRGDARQPRGGRAHRRLAHPRRDPRQGPVRPRQRGRRCATPTSPGIQASRAACCSRARRPGTPEAAFLKLNDPVTDGAAIRQAVLDGYVVRTRADADTQQARTGDTTMRDAALAQRRPMGEHRLPGARGPLRDGLCRDHPRWALPPGATPSSPRPVAPRPTSRIRRPWPTDEQPVRPQFATVVAVVGATVVVVRSTR